MPNNKRKRVSKIKGKEKAHPYSRKAKQISRAMHKETQISRAKTDRLNGAMAKGQKVVWFRDNMDSDQADGSIKKAWTKDELRELLGVYLKRNDEEVAQLTEKKGTRTLIPREALFLQAVEVEAKEARLAGIDVPDLTNGSVVKALRAWDGDVNSITTIKLITCKPLDAPSAEETDCSKNDGKLELDGAMAEDQEIAKLTGMVVG
ncbi:translation machinery-associated protein 16 [Coemansia sp. Benny D160-2]|nr:translation machinery-associated protein 16 [Coemansia sp. Benny D160-2]